MSRLLSYPSPHPGRACARPSASLPGEGREGGREAARGRRRAHARRSLVTHNLPTPTPNPSPQGGGELQSHEIKRRTPDQHRVAVEHNNLDRNVAAGNDALGCRLRRARDLIAERNASGLRKRKGFGGIVGAKNARAQFGRAAGGLRKARQRGWSADQSAPARASSSCRRRPQW